VRPSLEEAAIANSLVQGQSKDWLDNVWLQRRAANGCLAMLTRITTQPDWRRWSTMRFSDSMLIAGELFVTMLGMGYLFGALLGCGLSASRNS
jgi:hypothetical protein